MAVVALLNVWLTVVNSFDVSICGSPAGRISLGSEQHKNFEQTGWNTSGGHGPPLKAQIHDSHEAIKAFLRILSVDMDSTLLRYFAA